MRIYEPRSTIQRFEVLHDRVGLVLAAAASVTEQLDAQMHWWSRWDDWAP
ncbi:hypothetical protein [Cellulomonas humilata]|uniref:Uncharacterized protein n=1 Tax=Cellulomonas humilata TaxID=144055 RepID=A0ABU0EJS1_9CELL|nr:hypothetical protein [Cellulomonas humilata]MDQ0375540.1 hypothetical protein [Cellulomonas humilata]